jgi:hypothetical protein
MQYNVKRIIQEQFLIILLVGRLANSFLVFLVVVAVELIRLHVLFCCGILCFFVS